MISCQASKKSMLKVNEQKLENDHVNSIRSKIVNSSRLNAFDFKIDNIKIDLPPRKPSGEFLFIACYGTLAILFIVFGSIYVFGQFFEEASDRESVVTN